MRIILIFSSFCLFTSGCATTFEIKTSPVDAKLEVMNIESGEIFPVENNQNSFEYDDRYGKGFLIVAKKNGFATRKIFATPSSGASQSYIINLKPEGRNLASIDTMTPDENLKQITQELREQVKRDREDYERKLRALNDEKLKYLTDRLISEIRSSETKNEERIRSLENTLDIYKDALFSDRYSRGPASYDRTKIEDKIALIQKIQRLIEERKLDEASELTDKLLEKDEYLSQAHTLKGTIYYLKDSPKEAIRAWERALEINPNDKITQKYLTDAYKKIGIKSDRAPSSLDNEKQLLKPRRY